MVCDPVAGENVSNLLLLLNSRATSLDLLIHLFRIESPSPKSLNLQSLTKRVVSFPVIEPWKASAGTSTSICVNLWISSWCAMSSIHLSGASIGGLSISITP